jgi:DHA2 family multidrug resistance protein
MAGPCTALPLCGSANVPPDKANSVAGIINFMRNIRSSVGTFMVTTLLARVRQIVLSQHTTPFDPTL